MGRRVRSWIIVLAAFLAGLAWVPAAGAEPPPGFNDRVVIAGLEQPTSVAFADDGRVFVAEKRGVVLSFEDRSDPTPTMVADLRREVHSFYERGLMTIALDPAFPKRPQVYVGYTYDGTIGGPAPLWGRGGPDSDLCLLGTPDPSYEQGCPVASRVSRLTIGPDGTASAERVLLEDWCQQFPSHSIGDLAFDRRGALVVSGGEGAYFDGADLGDRGVPVNACGDPPGEGGALRAQDLRVPGDPVTLDGTIARIDPDDGSPAAGNPRAAPGNRGRIIAWGLRNPFRFALRPGTDELWIGDVGWDTTEEIDVTSLDRRRNFGWPCFEGRAAQKRYAAASNPLCSGLYGDARAVTWPWLSYRHGKHVARGEACPAIAPSAISGIAFDQGFRLPQPFDNALFFADYTRNCIWSIRAGRLGTPDRSTLRAFGSEAATPIDLESGPRGLYYVDLIGGAIHLISSRRPTVEVRLRSNPPGLPLRIDSRLERAGAEVTIVRGSEHALTAPARQRAGQMRLGFERWSDGGGRSHAVRPDGSRSYVAVYGCRRGCGAQ